MAGNLFDGPLKEKIAKTAPLAERMRPRSVAEFIGQEHLLGTGKILQKIIDSGQIPSMIFWGPPGCGKTSLARLIAHAPGHHFLAFSAVLSGVKEVREAIEVAKDRREFHDEKTILFVDEIHRFNKAQQDAFLPHVESGTIVLIGATTENPSFEINSPLLSRGRIVTLLPLVEAEIVKLLRAALGDAERGLGWLEIQADDEVLKAVARMSEGDGRRALNLLEVACAEAKPGAPFTLDLERVKTAGAGGHHVYDKSGEEHYNVISAFIKSLRGSDPDAALYWLARMLESGEDPHFILRRMVILASEDVGNADPQALPLVLAVQQAFDFVGLPEGWIPLAQGVVYLAQAPKSNASYKGYQAAKKDVEERGALPVPLHLRNAPTGLMKSLGYGKGYQYPHDFKGAKVAQQYLPDALKGKKYLPPDKA